MMHMQIHVQGDQRIGHIYFDYNLGTGGTGLDCAMLVTSKDWNGLWMITQVAPLIPQIPMAGQKSLI